MIIQIEINTTRLYSYKLDVLCLTFLIFLSLYLTALVVKK